MSQEKKFVIHNADGGFVKITSNGVKYVARYEDATIFDSYKNASNLIMAKNEKIYDISKLK